MNTEACKHAMVYDIAADKNDLGWHAATCAFCGASARRHWLLHPDSTFLVDDIVELLRLRALSDLKQIYSRELTTREFASKIVELVVHRLTVHENEQKPGENA